MSMRGKEFSWQGSRGTSRRIAGVATGLALALLLSACVQGPDDGIGRLPDAGSSGSATATEEASAMTTRITGSLAIRERIALPDNAYAMVEVRNSAGPVAMPVVVEQRIELGGKQPPVPFDFSVDRMRLPMDIGLAFRGALFVDGKPRYVSEQMPLNLTQDSIDLGMVLLKSFEAEPFATDMTCGNRSVRLSAGSSSMQINVDGTIHPLAETSSASGAKYVTSGDPVITLWNKGDEWSLAVGNEAPQPCRMGIAQAGDILTAHEWIVEDLDGAGIIDRSRISLTFTGDGRVTGRASCNTYSGSWTAEGATLTFGPAAVTQMACAPSLMTQEAKFLAIMQAAASFRMSETGALVIETSDGRSITAREAG